MEGLDAFDPCEFLEDCRFFALFGNEQGHRYSRFARVYCVGPLGDRCEKRRYRLHHGHPPGIGMTPTGESGSGD